MKNTWGGDCRACGCFVQPQAGELVRYLGRLFLFCCAHSNDVSFDRRITITARSTRTGRLIGGFVVSLDGEPWCDGREPRVFTVWGDADRAARDELRLRGASPASKEARANV